MDMSGLHHDPVTLLLGKPNLIVSFTIHSHIKFTSIIVTLFSTTFQSENNTYVRNLSDEGIQKCKIHIFPGKSKVLYK